MLENAVALGLVNRIEEPSGASVGMWVGIHAAPIEWGSLLDFGDAEPIVHPAPRPTLEEAEDAEMAMIAEHDASGDVNDFPCTQCGHRRTGQVPGCGCLGCDI